MTWIVRFHDDFEVEFARFEEDVQNQLLAAVKLLKNYGPSLGRPYADTLNGSNYVNMKELRFSTAGGVWRAAFAFDPARQAIVLIAGSKSGVNENRFYKWLIAVADRRYASHLEDLKRTAERKGS